MRDRALLALHKLDAFAAWAESIGYVREPCKGDYEVLRLRRGSEAPLIFHARSTAKEHATAWGDGERLVQRWLRNR